MYIYFKYTTFEGIHNLLYTTNILEKNNYDFFYQRISGLQNYFFNPWQSEDIVRNALTQMPSDIKDLFDFLLLGKSFEKDYIDNKFNNLTSICLDLGIAEECSNKTKLKNYSLLSYQGCYFLVNTLYSYNACSNKNSDVYIGLDTYWLTNILPKNIRGNVLYLCSGSGIQGIISSFHSIIYLMQKD